MRLFYLASLAFLLPACFDPSLHSGGLHCATNGTCPPGYSCSTVDQRCYLPGQGPLSNNGDDMAAGTSDGQSLGDACTQASDCVSGFCADGVCCESACDDACRTCALTGSAGTCLAVPSGQSPAAGHPNCGPDTTASCQRSGFCDGSGKCALYDNTTVCKAGGCNTTTDQLTAASKCDGAGTCVAPASVACAPFRCKSTGDTCATTCQTNADCSGTNPTCFQNSCGKRGLGVPCTGSTDCSSGFCVDGLCCDGTCSDRCSACDLAATPGNCMPVTSGQPHGTRPACMGSGAPCQGQCQAGLTTDCTYPTQSTSCSGACALGCNGQGACSPAPATTVCHQTCQYLYSPTGSYHLHQSFCDGQTLTCPTAESVTSCGTYQCNGSSCATTCSDPGWGTNTCDDSGYCSGGNCALRLSNGNACNCPVDYASGGCNECASGCCLETAPPGVCGANCS